MIEYVFNVKNGDGLRWRPYVARIEGRDPNYILHRVFEDVDYSRSAKIGIFRVELQSGLYEAAIIRTEKKTGKTVWGDRWWIIVADDDIYEYKFEEMNWQYALYTAFLVRVNCRIPLSS